MARAHALAARAAGVVAFQEIGPSEEGRPLPLLTIGDVTRDLPLLMVVGGTHGSEETGRAGAMAFAEWLADEGVAQLSRLSVIVIPCHNPDGTEANTYHNARDVNLYHAYPYNAPALTAEARAVEAVALDLLPDCVVDVHGLAGGAMGDSAFLIPRLDPFGLYTSIRLCAEIDAAASALGFPQRHPWVEEEFRRAEGSIADKMAAVTNAFCLTMETTENYYPLAESVRSVLARLRKLVEVGARVKFNQPYPGFPCDHLLGSAVGGLMAFGASYRQRRENRLKTMVTLLDTGFYLERSHADPGKVATLTFRLDGSWQTAPQGLVFQQALDPRAQVTRVSYLWADGEEGVLEPGGLEREHGYTLWYQDGIAMVRASVARPPGAGLHQVQVAYTAPFEPHVVPAWRVYSDEEA
jgi:hypothetical protein